MTRDRGVVATLPFRDLPPSHQGMAFAQVVAELWGVARICMPWLTQKPSSRFLERSGAEVIFPASGSRQRST